MSLRLEVLCDAAVSDDCHSWPVPCGVVDVGPSAYVPHDSRKCGAVIASLERQAIAEGWHRTRGRIGEFSCPACVAAANAVAPNPKPAKRRKASR